MTQEQRSEVIKNLGNVFNFIENLADAEAQKLKMYIKIRGVVDEDEECILKSEQKIQELRDNAENISRVIDLLVNEE